MNGQWPTRGRELGVLDRIAGALELTDHRLLQFLQRVVPEDCLHSAARVLFRNFAVLAVPPLVPVDRVTRHRRRVTRLGLIIAIVKGFLPFRHVRLDELKLRADVRARWTRSVVEHLTLEERRTVRVQILDVIQPRLFPLVLGGLFSIREPGDLAQLPKNLDRIVGLFLLGIRIGRHILVDDVRVDGARDLSAHRTVGDLPGNNKDFCDRRLTEVRITVRWCVRDPRVLLIHVQDRVDNAPLG